MYTNLWVCFYRKVYSIVIIVIGSPPLLTIQDSSRLTTNKVKNLRVSPDVGQHGAKSLATLGCAFAHPTAVGRRLFAGHGGKKTIQVFFFFRLSRPFH